MAYIHLILLLFVCVTAGNPALDSTNGSELKYTKSPESITLTINSESVQSRIHLSRSSLLDDPPSIHRVHDDGQSKEEPVDNTKTCLYVSEADDVISLSMTQHVHQGVQLWSVEGFLEVNGTEYFIVPSDKHHTSLLDHSGSRTGNYQLLRMKSSSVEKATLQLKARSDQHQTMSRVKRVAKTVYQIELGIFAAYDIYKSWSEKKQQMPLLFPDTSLNIRHFYYHVAAMIDKVFKTVQDPYFEVRVKLNKFFFASTKASSPWTETSVSGGTVNLALVLINFSNDIRSKRESGNTDYDFDTIVLFTGYPGKGSKNGASYLGDMCDTNSAAVVSTGLDFTESVLRASHEIGHSIGMFHDGDRNLCPATNGYNMAPQLSYSAGAKSNLWRFSSCSRDYVQTFISRLGPQNCLVKNSRRSYASQWWIVRRKLYGQHYGPHEQCKLLEHRDSYLCQNVAMDLKNICTDMLCYVPRLKRCRYIRPAAGTPCGNRMMCSSGMCVHDYRAKAIDVSCPFGDHQYEIFQGWTCRSLDAAGYMRSYNICQNYPRVRVSCCETCKKYIR